MTTTPLPEVARFAIELVRAGYWLCEYASGSKGPTIPGWNLPENAINTVERAARVTGNIGVLWSYCGMCCIDVDARGNAGDHLGGFGLDLEGWVAAGNALLIDRGHPDKIKLIFKLPPGVTLQTKMFTRHGYELRCMSSRGTSMQDVLPPSWHPSGAQYRFIGDFRNPPPIPSDLLEFWQNLSIRPERLEAKPLGAGRPELETLLAKIDPNELVYEEWLSVGMALHHETQGSSVGLILWDQWSSRFKRYTEGYQEPKYYSFKSDAENPVTLRSLMHMAGQGIEPPFEDLTALAADVEAVLPADEPKGILVHRSVDLAELEAPPKPPRVIVDQQLLEDACGLVAPGGTGKTSLALFEGVHIILGKELWGRKIVKPGAVLFVSAEDSREVMVGRLSQICTALGLSRVEKKRVANHFFLEDVSIQNCKLVEPDSNGVLRATKFAGEIIRKYRGDGVSLAHFDPASLLGPGEMHGNDGMSELMRIMRWTSTGLGAASQMCHHVAQMVARGGIQDQYAGRGGTAWADNSRGQRQVNKIKERDYSFNGINYRLPNSIVDEDIERGRILVMLVHKLSYVEVDPTPTFIYRQGFSFQQFEAGKAARTVDSDPAMDAEKIARFLVLDSGVYSKYSLEKSQLASLGMTQTALRAALEYGEMNGILRQDKMPSTGKRGGQLYRLVAVDPSL